MCGFFFLRKAARLTTQRRRRPYKGVGAQPPSPLKKSGVNDVCVLHGDFGPLGVSGGGQGGWVAAVSARVGVEVSAFLGC